VTWDEDVNPRERKIARWLAGGMHVALLLLLIFGVSWQRRHSEPAAVVDLWSSMAPPKQDTPPLPPPPPRPAPKIEKPRPEPAPPPPKPEVKAIPKADIALKEKLEKERKVKEQQEVEKKKQHELERRKDDEAKKLKTQQQVERKKEEEKNKVDKERLAQDAEAKKLAAEKQALADKLAKQAAAAQAGEIDKYRRMMESRIKRFLVEPPNLQGNPEVEVEFRMAGGGDVLEHTVKVRRSSGNLAYDQAVERAILKASPFEVPPPGPLFDQLRELNLKVRPK
jgi:colicin import membrane protein